MKILSSTLITIVFGLGPLISTVSAQTPIGYVLEIQGDWRLNGNNSSALKRWQKLPSAATVNIVAPTPEARIVIARLSGEILKSRNCRNEDCSRPIELPQGTPQRSLLRVAFEGTRELLFGFSSFYSYSIHRNRTFDEALADGVVRLDKGVVDFSPVLRETGSYYVRWRRRSRSVQAGKWSKPVSLGSGRDSPIATGNFAPGLCEVNLQRLVGDSYETFASAWVLLSTSAKYDSNAASFQQALELTKRWGALVEPDTSRAFLRAHLDYLAGQSAK